MILDVKGGTHKFPTLFSSIMIVMDDKVDDVLFVVDYFFSGIYFLPYIDNL